LLRSALAAEAPPSADGSNRIQVSGYDFGSPSIQRQLFLAISALGDPLLALPLFEDTATQLASLN
jgi:hypothetical protein